MFGAIDTLLIRTPAHVRDASRVSRIYFATPPRDGSESIPWPRVDYRTYATLRDNAPSLEGIAGFWTKTISSGRGADARSLGAVAVTPSYFTLLGTRPAVGRFFAANEERDEADHVAVLGYETWRGQFNGDSAVLGRTIDVVGTPYTIIGVAPKGFTGINIARVDLWLPLGVASRLLVPGALEMRNGGYWLEMIAKRRVSATDAQLAGEITKQYRDLHRDSPRYETTFGKTNTVLGPIVEARGPTKNPDAKVALWVAVVSLLVLLIASANVANLLLLRGLTRSREVALRLSLGATRWRVMRQWLVEGALLAIAGAVCAVALARWSASAMRAFLLPDAPHDNVFDLRLLAFTAVVAIGTGLL
ncbi:MAG: ABC transporter permease, partial [Solirubrobacteraceae bacterium]